MTAGRACASWSGPSRARRPRAKSSKRRRSVALRAVATSASSRRRRAAPGVMSIALERLVVALVEDGGAADRVGLGDGGGLGCWRRGCAASPRRRAGWRRARAAAPAPTTSGRAGGGALPESLLDLVAGVGEHVVEEVAVGRGEAVGLVAGEPVARGRVCPRRGSGGCRRGGAARSGGRGARRPLASLDEVGGARGRGRGRPRRLRKASSLPVCGVAVTRMRWRLWVGGEVAQQLVALVAAGACPAPEPATQVWASSTITSSGQRRRNSWRRRSDLMKSVETMTCG